LIPSTDRWAAGGVGPCALHRRPALRTKQHFTLKQNPLRRMHLDEFVDYYQPDGPRSERMESERFRSFTYHELVTRDKTNLDITWLRDESLEDLDNLPAPEVVAR